MPLQYFGRAKAYNTRAIITIPCPFCWCLPKLRCVIFSTTPHVPTYINTYECGCPSKYSLVVLYPSRYRSRTTIPHNCTLSRTAAAAAWHGDATIRAQTTTTTVRLHNTQPTNNTSVRPYRGRHTLGCIFHAKRSPNRKVSPPPPIPSERRQSGRGGCRAGSAGQRIYLLENAICVSIRMGTMQS